MVNDKMGKNDILFSQLNDLDTETIEDGMCHFFHTQMNWKCDVLDELLEQNEAMLLEYHHIMCQQLVKEVSEKDLVEYFDIEGTPEFRKEQELCACERLLEEHGFKYDRYNEQGVCVGIEFSKHTQLGVEMGFLIDGRDKDMTEDGWWRSEIYEIYDNFDVDEQIDSYRQDDQFRKDFTIRQSLEDFEDFEKKLKALYDAA